MTDDSIDISQFMFRIPVVVRNIDSCNVHHRIHVIGLVSVAPQHAAYGFRDADLATDARDFVADDR
jgi:hypothetical protein